MSEVDKLLHKYGEHLYILDTCDCWIERNKCRVWLEEINDKLSKMRVINFVERLKAYNVHGLCEFKNEFSNEDIERIKNGGY